MSSNKKMQRKIRWQERMRDILDVPLEGISNWSTVQIVGDCEISVSGCEGVLIYMPDRVLLRGVSGNVLILGEHLEMHSLSGDRITVCGRIPRFGAALSERHTSVLSAPTVVYPLWI